ncbi:unnamed protein product [Cylindrotheca closterium]|uniref:Uncharacterized protein n=1 Tax=Cylindrotheca closterium TaxID=2856 RepID=A0AAD2CB94_9STRA|nr:unnamed protein product [Cylindrotheca closterium]
MSTIEKDGKENTSNRRMSGMDEKPSVAASIKTPSKSTRYSLGSASKYYFKYMNSSAKKKQKKNTSLVQEDNPNFYLDYMNSGTKKPKGAYNEDDTGNLSLLSIPELAGKSSTSNNNSSLDTSVLSLASSSSEGSDLLNKTTSSDTTELTASNFVLAATSRAKVRELSLDHSVWTKNEAVKPTTEQPKPVIAQPPSSRKPLGERQFSETSTNIKATLSQDSTGTAPAATPSGRRLSMRGVSPSLRSRISASPKSLRKFTEDLKNSRLQRQMQREMSARKNSAGNSGLLNNSVASALDSSLLLDGSGLSVIKKKRSRASMMPRIGSTRDDKKETSMMSNDSGDTTDDILGAMDEIFGLANSDDYTEALSEKPKRSSVTATASAVNEALSQESTEEDPTNDSIPVAVAFQRSRRSSGIMEQPEQLDETEGALASTKSSEASSNAEMEFSNVNETKSTPTKLAPTPHSIANPRLLDSPARNTRSAKKQLSHSRNDDAASLGDLGDMLGGVSDNMSAKSSTTEKDSDINGSPLHKNTNSQRSFGSGEKSELSVETGREADGDTASVGVYGDLLGELTQESISCQHEESTVETGEEGVIPSPGPSVSHKNNSPQQSQAKEGTTPTKLVPTPAARDTESIAKLGGVLDIDSEVENATEQKNSQSPAVSNLLTQRSMGSEEKPGISDETDVGGTTETASLGDLGGLFGGLTDESTGNKQDESTADDDNEEVVQSPVERSPKKNDEKEGTTITKLAPTPQRMENPRLLDSPARNTRSAKKQQSHSTAGDAESMGDICANSSNADQEQSSSAISNLLTQRSIGSEEKSVFSSKGDTTETLSFPDIGDIFGVLTQTTAESNSPMAPRQTYFENADSQVIESEKTQAEDASVEKLLTKDSDQRGPSQDSKVPSSPSDYLAPAKLAPTPQRMEKPRFLDSPARNTRSAKKQQSSRDDENTASVAFRAVDLGDGAVNGNISQGQSRSQDKVSSQRSFGSEEKSSPLHEKNTFTETASLGDIGDILGEIPQSSPEKASTSQTSQEDAVVLNSPPRVGRSSMEDSGFDIPSPSKDSTEGLDDSSTSFNAQSEQKSQPSKSYPSPQNELLDRDSSQTKTKESTTKLTTTPQRIENARFLDSPARNTRSGKKQQSSVDDTGDHTASIAADLSSIFGSSTKRRSMDASMNRDQALSPSENNELSQRSFGSVEKVDIQDSDTNTDTASLADIGDILSGLSQDTGYNSSPVAESLRGPDSPRQEHSSPVEQMEEKAIFSQRSFGSEQKSIRSDDENKGDDTETATIGDIGNIFGGLTEPSAEDSPAISLRRAASAVLDTHRSVNETTDSEETVLENSLIESNEKENDVMQGESNQSIGIDASNEGVDQSINLSSPPRMSQSRPSSGLRLNSSQRKRRATPTKLAPTPERILNPKLVNSPARNTRSSKRKHHEGDDSSSVSISSSIPSSESDEENLSSSKRHQLTKESFGSDLSVSKDDENDTRTAASMEEINSILFELAQQAPTEGSPIAELNPIVQNFDASQNASQFKDDTGDLSRSQISKEGLERNHSHMSMSSVEEETSQSMRNTRSHHSMMSEASRDHSIDMGSQRQGTPSKVSSTQKSPMRLQPNSHVKPTPTKIQPSPRRVLNPRSIHSPARNTRSARKAAEVHNMESDQETREESKRKLPPYDSEDLRSPMPKKFKPVGILSSKKRRAQKTDSAQRTISFGSPEAALYHVGSPSGNFTPLPRSRAKALFAIPSKNESTSSSDVSGEETVGIESNMHILVDRITADNMQESPELSPIANDQDSSRIHNLSASGKKSMDETEDSRGDNEHTVELELGIDQLLANASKGIEGENEHTVQLEGGMEQLVANALNSEAKAPPPTNIEKFTDTRNSSPADSSVDMADSRSIASMNAQTGKYTSEFKMTAMDAQKLDFSIQASESDSDDSMDVDEGNTVPLEVDMTSLLAANGTLGKKKEIIDNSVDTTEDECQSPPRPPVATARFSLSQADSPESVKAFENLLGRQAEDLAISKAETNESQIRSSQSLSEEFLSEPYTLTLDELCEIGDLESNNKPEGPGGTSQDAVVEFNAMVEERNSIAISRWNQFLQAVCGEVENQDQDLDGKAASEYDDILSEQSPHMRKLEAMLRSEQGTEVQENIRALVKANKDNVEAEWNDWLKNLLEAFSSEWLPALSNDLKKECSTLDTISELGVQASTKIAAIKDKKVRRARRKSIGRRKSLARSLHDEIKELEAEISLTKAALDDKKEKESAIDATIDELQEIQVLANEAKALRADAAPSQKAYMSLKGLHSWNPTSMNESNLAFEAVGQYVQTTNTITYNLEGPSISTAVSHSDSSTETMKYSSKSTSAIVKYLSACVDEHSSAVRQKTVPSAAEIGTSMQSYMWHLGRLDHTVTELQSLKKRYTTTFSSKGSRFVFSVEYKNSSTSLLAEFDIDHNYPALPLEVQLNLIKGDIDLDRVRRGLRKSAKPGFGNLSRACGIISAFVP